MWPFKKKSKTAEQPVQSLAVEHAVIVHTGSSSVSIEQVYEISDSLRDILERQNIGELDGHEIAVSGSDAVFYLYGPNARSLYLEIEEILKLHEITKTGTAYLRFGDVSDADALEINLNIVDGLPDVH